MVRRARDRLAQKLRMLRTMRDRTQEDLAAASGLHRTYISLVERAECNISLDNLEKLADAFGQSVTDLLGATEPARFDEHLLAKLLKSIKRRES